MKNRTLFASLLLAGSMALIPAMSLARNAANLAGGTFKVDVTHSSVVFRTTHLNTGASWGRVNDPTGTFVIEGDDLSVDVTLDMNKIDTFNEKRDQHLRGPDFFNVKQFPTWTFKSKSSKKVSDTQFEVTGDLTVKGVTKEIAVTFNKIGETDGGERFGYRAGFEAEFTINRMDYGISYMPDGLGKEVKVIVALEGVRE